MTTEQRLERQLPELLEGLYLGPAPDYRDEVLAAAVAKRQRPSWTFPGRWLPMTDIASSPAWAPRVPWRTTVVVLVVLALILAAMAVFVGSRGTRKPAPPFGLAGNGLIAASLDGDIAAIDPSTGTVAPIVTGPEADTAPMFSPDGARIAFVRFHAGTETAAYDIVVADADGSHRSVVNSDPIVGERRRIEWAPDSRSLLVGGPHDEKLWLFDTTRTGSPREVATDAFAFVRPFRPPDGSSILIGRSNAQGTAMALLDLATTRETVLATGDIGAARWSPDGSRIVFDMVPDGDPQSHRLFSILADGSGLQRLTSAPGSWVETDVAWSPDGSRIAFGRWEQVRPDTWAVRPVGIYSVADGTVTDIGPTPPDSGYYFEWSPDGRSLLAIGASTGAHHPLLIDVADGTSHELGPEMEADLPTQSWQRTAP